VYYDFDQFGWDDFNFVIDPEHWYLAGRLPGNIWRVTYGEDVSLSAEECIQKQPEKFEKMLPGHPRPLQYKLTHISPYKIHQRCAERMRVGRFLLAGDAGHICNPL
jgi:2-polyprenyl-6-methoxyphenol hydroxylase-like FAD-dependent oxidoreductase